MTDALTRRVRLAWLAGFCVLVALAGCTPAATHEPEDPPQPLEVATDTPAPATAAPAASATAAATRTPAPTPPATAAAPTPTELPGMLVLAVEDALDDAANGGSDCRTAQGASPGAALDFSAARIYFVPAERALLVEVQLAPGLTVSATLANAYSTFYEVIAIVPNSAFRQFTLRQHAGAFSQGELDPFTSTVKPDSAALVTRAPDDTTLRFTLPGFVSAEATGTLQLIVIGGYKLTETSDCIGDALPNPVGDQAQPMEISLDALRELGAGTPRP